MKKNLLLIILSGLMVYFYLELGLSAREKTEIIGKFTWYTEQNSFEEMVQIAKRSNKPILAVFSAEWCGPCQSVKKRVFKKDDFKRVADEVALLYIEQTRELGKAYNKKFKISGFPTFKIFSKDGIMLETGFPDFTIDGFLEWIKDVKAGNNFYEMSKKLERNPNDRETLVKIADKVAWSEKEKIISYLKKAIHLNTDFNDEIAQKAYERLAFQLAVSVPSHDEKERTEFINNHRKLFQDIINAYYPDKFKYTLKGDLGPFWIINWFNEIKDFDKALPYFSDFLKRKGEKIDLEKDIKLIHSAITTYLGLGKKQDAVKWVIKIKELVKSNNKENIKKDRNFLSYYLGMYRLIIEYFAEVKNIKEAEKYAELFFEELDRFGQTKMKEVLIMYYASHYGIITDRALKSIEKQLKTAKGIQVVNLTTSGAEILIKSGRKVEAERKLITLYENKDFFESLEDHLIPEALNSIAWKMVELKIVNQKSLEIAKKAVSLKPSSMIMDTLACVYAELGNLKEAIKIERQALEKAKEESEKKEYREKIREWEKKIK